MNGNSLLLETKDAVVMISGQKPFKKIFDEFTTKVMPSYWRCLGVVKDNYLYDYIYENKPSVAKKISPFPEYFSYKESEFPFQEESTKELKFPFYKELNKILKNESEVKKRVKTGC
jgi:hypothetical protein